MSDGLIAYYPFNGNANDISGNGYHGVISGPITYDSEGAIFNGTSSFITCPNYNLNPTDAIIFKIDIKPSKDATNIANSQRLFNLNYIRLHIRDVMNSINFRYDNSGARIIGYNLGNGFRGSVNIIGVYNGDKQLLIYINGIYYTSRNFSVGPAANYGQNIFGKNSTEYYGGKMKNVIFKKITSVPSNAEILSFYQNGTIPSISDVTIIGTPAVGENLSSSYVYSGILDEGTETYQRYKNGVEIVGETNKIYVVRPYDIYQKIKCLITPYNRLGEVGTAVFTNEVSIVNPPPSEIVLQNKYYEYVLKLYSNQNSEQPYNSVEDINNIEFSRDLNDFSTLKMDLPINVSGLRQFNKIELCCVCEGEDIILFGGYINNIKPGVGKISVECRDYKALLLKKIILSDKDFIAVTPTSAFENIFLEWKTETNENWFFETSYTGTFSKKFSEGDNWFDILDEIGELCGCVWTIRDGNTIVFNEIIGEDRTDRFSERFFELIYNGEDFGENNIDNIEVETYSTLSNMIVGKTPDNTKVNLKDNTSITSFGVFAEYKNFRDGDLTVQTQKYLDTKKYEQKVYNITISKNIGDELNIGDKIHLRIENLNEYMNIETDVFVLQKQVRIENGTKIINVTISEIYAYIEDFTGKINRIQKDLSLLSL